MTFYSLVVGQFLVGRIYQDLGHSFRAADYTSGM